MISVVGETKSSEIVAKRRCFAGEILVALGYQPPIQPINNPMPLGFQGAFYPEVVDLVEVSPCGKSIRPPSPTTVSFLPGTLTRPAATLSRAHGRGGRPSPPAEGE